MNEMNESVELLKVMKDLNGQGFRLTKEINALIKQLLLEKGLTYEIIYGDCSINNLSKFSTVDLVKELSKRESVQKFEIDPHGGNGKLIIDNYHEGFNAPIDGAAIILVIKD